MSLDNFGFKGTDPPRSQKSPYNFIVGTSYSQTQPTVDKSSSTVVYIQWKKSEYKWTHLFQTHVVQVSAVLFWAF